MSFVDLVGSFELVGNFQAVIGDLVSDPDYEPDVVPLAAGVTFTANVSGPIRGRRFDPPTAYVIAPVEAMIDPADGLLKLRPEPDPQALEVLSGTVDGSALLRSVDPLLLCRMSVDQAEGLARCWSDARSRSAAPVSDPAVKVCLGEIRSDIDTVAVAPYAPVRLLCDSPLHELDRPLQWTARFSSVRYGRNGSASIDPFTFNAPSEPVVLDLVSVMRAPGQVANGITAGPKGDAATIAVGSVTTGVPGSSASVTNVGDASDAVFDFRIPRGDKGDKGDQGIPGAANTAPDTHAAPVKASPVDADELPLVDSAASWGLKKLTWANLKAAFAAYYNTLTATLTNKTLQSPTITGTPLSPFADTVNAVAGRKYLANVPVVADAFSADTSGGSTVVGLHNELAYLTHRGGAVTVTKNGTDISATVQPENWFLPGGSVNLAVDATSDVFVITINAPTVIPYSSYWGFGQLGLNFRSGFTAKDVKFEANVGGTWTTFYNVTNDASNMHFARYSTLNPPYTSQFRITLTNHVYVLASGLRIQNIWATSASGNPPAHSMLTFLPRNGGQIYGTTAVPPTFTAAGSDADIDIRLAAKGSGAVQANGGVVATTTTAQTLTNKTLTNPKINQIVSTDGSGCISFNNNAPNGTYAELKNDQKVTQFIARSSVDADVDLSLFSKGAGTVKANGVPIVTTTGSQTLTNKTLTAPTVSTFKDANGATVLSFQPDASAANYINISNRAAGSPPHIYAVGADADISLNLAPKGTGQVQANGVPVVTTTGSQTLTGKTISGANNTLTAIPVGALTTTGTPSASTYLRGDGTWAAVAGGVESVAGRTGVVTLTTADLTDATTVGKAVATAADAAAARTAIGAGTSNLAIGTTGSTAKAGNYTPTSGEVTTALGFTPQNTATAVSGSQAGVGAALTLWTGTQAQYDAIATKSSTTVYVIV